MRDDWILHLCISAHMTSSTALWKLFKYLITQKCAELIRYLFYKGWLDMDHLGQIQNRTHMVPIVTHMGLPMWVPCCQSHLSPIKGSHRTHIISHKGLLWVPYPLLTGVHSIKKRTVTPLTFFMELCHFVFISIGIVSAL